MMEHKLEAVYMMAAAVLFVSAVMGWIKVENVYTECLVRLEQQLNEERVVVRTGGI